MMKMMLNNCANIDNGSARKPETRGLATSGRSPHSMPAGLLVPKLRLGNPGAASSSLPCLGKLQLPELHSQAGAWERTQAPAWEPRAKVGYAFMPLRVPRTFYGLGHRNARLVQADRQTSKASFELPVGPMQEFKACFGRLTRNPARGGAQP
jgi:hypothetical protein